VEFLGGRAVRSGEIACTILPLMEEPQSRLSTVTPRIDPEPSGTPVSSSTESQAPAATGVVPVISVIAEILEVARAEAEAALSTADSELASDLAIRVSLIAWDAAIGSDDDEDLLDRCLSTPSGHPLAARVQLARALASTGPQALAGAQAWIHRADPVQRSELALWFAEAWQLGHGSAPPAAILELVVAGPSQHGCELARVSGFALDRVAALAVAAARRSGNDDQRAEAACLLLDGGGDPREAALLCARSADSNPAARLRCLDLAIEARLRGAANESVADLWLERSRLIAELGDGALEAAVSHVLAIENQTSVANGQTASSPSASNHEELAALAELPATSDPRFGPLYLRMRSLAHAVAAHDLVAATALRQRLASDSPSQLVAACHAARAAMSLESSAASPQRISQLATLACQSMTGASLAALRDRAWLRVAPDDPKLVRHLAGRGATATRWAAHLAERRFSDLPGATALWIQVANAPSTEWSFAFDHLASCHRRARRQDALAETYRNLAAREDTVRCSAVWRCAEGVLALRSGDLAQARRLLEGALEVSPRDLVARLALLRVHTEAQDWASVATMLEPLRECLLVPSTRRRYLRELAIVLESHLQRSSESELTFEQMLSEDPLDTETLVALGDLYQRLDKPMLAIAAKRRAIDLLADRGAKLRLLKQIAALCETHNEFEDRRAALEHAQQLDPEDIEVQRSLSELYEQLGQSERAVMSIRAELARNPPAPRRIEVQLRLAALLARLEQEPEAVVATYLEILVADPGHAEALAGIQAPARALGWWDALLRAFRAAPPTAENLEILSDALEKMLSWSELARVRELQLQALPAGHDKAQRAIELATLYERQVGDCDAAIRLLTMARSLSPEAASDEAVRRSLTSLLERQQRWGELVDCCEEELASSAASSVQRRVELLLRLGQLRGEQLKEIDAGVVACEAVLVLSPDHPEALRMLEGFYRQLGNSRALIHVLRRRLDGVAGGPAKSAMLAQLARLHVANGEIADAVLAYQSAIETWAGDRDTFTAFERLCYTQQRWADALALYSVAIAHVESGGVRAYRLSDLYSRKAQVQSQYLDDLDGAIESLSRLISLDISPEAGARALEQICAIRRDYEPLVAAFERRAETTRDPARRADAFRRAAVFASTYLGQPDREAGLRQKLLAIDPNDAGNVVALEAHFRQGGDIAALMQLLQQQLASSRDRSTTIGLLQRIAQVSEEEARDVDGAISHYLKVIELEPSHLESLEALGRIYESTERWVEFIDITRRQIKGTSDRDNKALLYFRCGSVMEAKFNREDDAIRYYEAAIKVAPSCMPAVHGLRDLYRGRLDWPRVIETLELEVKLWQEDKERAGVIAQIGQVYADHLGDSGNALTYLNDALAVDPECVPANWALFEHYFSSGNWDQALPLANALTQKAMRDGDPGTRSDFYRKRGEVSLRTGDPKVAADSFVIALEIRPMNLEALEALGALVRSHHEIYEFEATYRELERVYRRREDSSPLMARVWVGLATLAERAGDLDAAAELYAAAAGLVPADFTVLSAVVDFHSDMRHWSAATSAIEAFLPQASPEDRTRALLRQAEIHADGEFDTLRAITVLREITRVDVHCLDAHYLLAQQYFLHGRFAEARAAMERAIDLATAPGTAPSAEVLARFYYYKGRILEAAGDPRTAAAQYRRASEYDPSYAPPVLILARRASDAGDDRYAETLLIEAARAAIAQGGAIAAVPLQRGLARMLLSTDRTAAIEAYRGILNVTPDNASDRVALAEIYAVEDLPRAIAELRKVIDRDIHHAPAYRLLASFYARIGEIERAGRVLAALDLLGFAEDSDRSTAQRMRAVRLSTPLLRSLDEDHRYHLLATPAVRDVLGELWSGLAAEITALFPSPSLGENLAPMSSLEDPSFEADFFAVARVFATTAEVFVGDNVPGMAVVVAFPRPLIAIDRGLVKEGSPARQFLFGWALDAIRGGYAMLLTLGAAQRRELTQLLRALFASDAERSGMASDLARRAGVRAASVLDAYAGRIRDLDVGGWIDGMQAAAKRSGLLVCDEFAAAIWMIARLSGERLPSHHAMVALGAVLGGPDLVRYYLSDDYQRLRNVLTEPAGSS
jgi:tetratricopeptide (TPR) repeat protein